MLLNLAELNPTTGNERSYFCLFHLLRTNCYSKIICRKVFDLMLNVLQETVLGGYQMFSRGHLEFR